MDALDTTPFKHCSRRETCIHPDGPLLPATTEFFYRHSKSADGLQYICKVCQKALVKQNRADNVEKRRAYYRAYNASHAAEQKAWADKNRDKRRATYRRYHQRNAERRRAYRRDYYWNHLEEVRAYREENRERSRAYQHEYYLAHRSHVLERQKAYNREHPERRRAYARKYSQGEHSRAYHRAWRAKNRDRIRVYEARYRAKHPERVEAYAITHRAEARARNNRRHVLKKTSIVYREKRKIAVHLRRARIAGAPGTHSAADVLLQIKAQTDRKGDLHCWWCKKKIKDGQYDVDHRTPLVRGGSNGPENLVIACRFCNRSKGTKTPAEFDGRLF